MAVWNRFADELTELVDLKVKFPLEMPEMESDLYLESVHLRYVQCFPHGFSSHSTLNVPGTEQDIPMLEALTTMVRHRKELISCDRG